MPDITITRLAPGDQKVELDWWMAPTPVTAMITIEFKRRDMTWTEASRVIVRQGSCRTIVKGLQNGVDYELRLQGRDQQTNAILAESAVRIVRPGLVPGVVVNYIHPDDFTYNSSGRSPASPSLAMLPDGSYVASHDIYWGKHGQNLSMVFRSKDGGETWAFLTELYPCFWGKLFVHRGVLYMLSTSTEYGALLIRRSGDNGATWSEPTEILPAGDHQNGGPHKAPMPVLEFAGRLWSAIEFGSWQRGAHDAGVVSVPVEADLLDPASWTVSGFLGYDPSWPGTISGGQRPSILEGNVVVSPHGELIDFLRYNTIGGNPDYGKAVMLKVNNEHPEALLSFHGVADFPGNMSKFTIKYDPVSTRYWSLVNRVNSSNIRQRNILTLVSSSDLFNWEICKDILNYEDNDWNEDSTKVGFQYVDWAFEEDDIIALSRTAINGAFNYHNANHITFHRISGFRSQLG